MKVIEGTPRVNEGIPANPEDGVVRWEPIRSLWYIFHLVMAVVGGYLYFTWAAFFIFIVFTAISLCLGHSLGMHRRLIHKSYDCPKWMEYLFVHFGVLVGLAGPFGLIRQHDLRDWAQRKSQCHSFLRHGESLMKDGWWQLHCDLVLEKQPEINIEREVKDDIVYQWMERTWMLQQLPWTILLFFCGGVGWVFWGICARVAVSITGHWLVGYFAHNEGDRDWHVDGAAVQGHNVKFLALLTMGESWHNNHHAYPGSAILGIYKHQLDPGWWVLNRLMNIGMVWNVKLPTDLAPRPELKKIKGNDKNQSMFRKPEFCPLFGV